jgi:hypothetical protein
MESRCKTSIKPGDCDIQELQNAWLLLIVANSQLRGQSDLEKAQVLQWLGFADSEILPASYAWVFPCLGIMQYNKQVRNIGMVKSCSEGPCHHLCFTHI